MSAAEFNFVQCIPALPGNFLLAVSIGDSGRPEEVDKEPIVAWAIEEVSYAAYPITAEGVNLNFTPVLRPDGTVARTGDAWWPDVNDWLRDQQEEFDAKQEGV